MARNHDGKLKTLILAVGLLVNADSTGYAAIRLDDIPDPMHPLQQSWQDDPETQNGLHLQSILVAGDRRSAIINGELLTIGSQIDHSRIIGIMHDAVIIRQNGQRKVLRLNTRNIVKPSKGQEANHD